MVFIVGGIYEFVDDIDSPSLHCLIEMTNGAEYGRMLHTLKDMSWMDVGYGTNKMSQLTESLTTLGRDSQSSELKGVQPLLIILVT
jgi:hypothetical protein